jgi:protein SCO1
MRLGFVLGLALIGAVLAVSVVVLAGGSESNGRPDSRSGAYRGSEPPAGIQMPTVALRSYRGELVQMSAFRGRVVVVTFLETKCKEACPIIAGEIGHGLGLLGPSERRAVVAIAISTHPKDDTRANVRAFLRRHRAEAELDYLIGSEAQLRPVWKAFHVLSALDSGDANTHSASVRIYDGNGEWVSTLHAGVDLSPANLAHDIALAEAS